MKPTFLCGNDNRTYSSPCRLEYHNCIHHTSVRIACKGFCPCKGERIACKRVFFPNEAKKRVLCTRIGTSVEFDVARILLLRVERNLAVTTSFSQLVFSNDSVAAARYTHKHCANTVDFYYFFFFFFFYRI